MVIKNSIGSMPIEISLGGTNSTSFSTSDGIVKFDGTRLVSSSTATINSSDECINTAQPSFSAYLDSTKLNKTGNATIYNIGADALTEIFDQGGDFNVNGTFTAPITGRYLFTSHASLTGCTIGYLASHQIVTSNRYYAFLYIRNAASTDWFTDCECLADMDAGDTAYSRITGSGEAGNTEDIVGSANFNTGFSGCLVC